MFENSVCCHHVKYNMFYGVVMNDYNSWSVLAREVFYYNYTSTAGHVRDK